MFRVLLIFFPFVHFFAASGRENAHPRKQKLSDVAEGKLRRTSLVHAVCDLSLYLHVPVSLYLPVRGRRDSADRSVPRGMTTVSASRLASSG